MEERKLNFNVPLLSVRRISETPGEIKIKKTLLQNPDTKKNYLIPNSDHLTRPASVPFVWEQIPGRPKDDQAISGHTDADVLSDPFEAFSADWSVSTSSEFDDYRSKNSEKPSIDLQFQEYMMRRFLLAAKAVALEQQNLNFIKEQPNQNQETVFAVRTQPPLYFRPFYHDVDDDDHDEVEDEEDNVSSNVTRKLFTDCIRDPDRKSLGFLPRICAENSVCVLNAVSRLPEMARRSLISSETPDLGKPGKPRHRKPKTAGKRKPGFEVGVFRLCRTNQSVKEPSEKILPGWSSRDLSRYISPYRSASNRETLRSGTPEESKRFRDSELKRFRKGISRSQELFPKGMKGNSVLNSPVSEKTLNVDTVSVINAANRLSSRLGTPSRFGGIQKEGSVQDGEFLPRNGNASSRRSKSLDPVETAVDKHVTREEIARGGAKTPTPLPPPLPKTPTDSWLWRTLPSMRPRNSISVNPWHQNPYG